MIKVNTNKNILVKIRLKMTGISEDRCLDTNYPYVNSSNNLNLNVLNKIK